MANDDRLKSWTHIASYIKPDHVIDPLPANMRPPDGKYYIRFHPDDLSVNIDKYDKTQIFVQPFMTQEPVVGEQFLEIIRLLNRNEKKIGYIYACLPETNSSCAYPIKYTDTSPSSESLENYCLIEREEKKDGKMLMNFICIDSDKQKWKLVLENDHPKWQKS